MSKKLTINIVRLFFTLSIFSFLKTLNAQNDLKIGEWRTYLPYQRATYVTQSNTHVFYSTGISILKIDKTDFSTDRIDRLDGLSDATPSIVRYNKSNNNLMVVYANSAIDLLKPDGEIITLNDIKNNNAIIGDKRIYNISFTNDTAYLACGFGIVKLNMKRNEFVFTTFTKSSKVKSVVPYNGKLYAATEGGIYAVNNDSRINLADFSTWQLLSESKGFPRGAYNSNVLCVFNSRLYMDVNDTLKVLQENDTPLSIFNKNGNRIQYLTAEGNNLLMGLWCGEECSGAVFVVDKNNKVQQTNGCSFRPLYGIEDAQGRFYLADLYDPIKTMKNATSTCDRFDINSPIFQSGSSFAINDTTLLVASGGVEGINARISAEGFAELKNGSWTNYNRFNYNILAEKEADIATQSVAINPQNGKLYGGTYWGGLIEAQNGKILNIFNDKNSTLQGAFGDEQRERIAGLAFDKNGNLWVSNTSAPFPISVLKADGKWKLMSSVPSGANLIFQVAIDSSGNKWFASGSALAGILIYNEGKNIDDLSDDKVRMIDNSFFPAELQTARVNCITVDLEGRVWVGTSNGVAVFDCGSDPFRETCVARQIISSLGGINEYLLREKNVQAIAVDGANRKWFGTTSGIFVTSADGREEVAKFNTDNSPLMSNNITSLGMRLKTGEVFVATSRGLMTYRTDAIAGEEFNQRTAYAFPNPVRPDYEGPIAIKGLARDANVKITDINGNIVYETEALGGQAIWNGKNFAGERVATGVYLVYSTNTQNLDAPEAIVTKILFIK